MLAIRLVRVGRKHVYKYRLIIQDKKKSPLSGRRVDEVGSFDATTKNFIFDNAKITHWISVGAQPSQRVARLLVKNGFNNAQKFIVKVDVSTQKQAFADKQHLENEAKAKVAAETAAAEKVKQDEADVAAKAAETEKVEEDKVEENKSDVKVPDTAESTK